MQGVNIGYVKSVLGDCSAVIDRIDRLNTFAAQIHAQLKYRDQFGSLSLADRHGIADMIVMSVGEHDMLYTGRRLFNRLADRLKTGIAGKERINNKRCLICIDPETGMSIPGNLHMVCLAI